MFSTGNLGYTLGGLGRLVLLAEFTAPLGKWHELNTNSVLGG
jgi:hypothetical protein